MTAAHRAARSVFARKSAESAFYRDVQQRTAANADTARHTAGSFRARTERAARSEQEIIEPGLRRDFRQQARPTVVFTLDQQGNPELPDPRRRGGYFPYLTTGQVKFAADPGMLIDFHV